MTRRSTHRPSWRMLDLQRHQCGGRRLLFETTDQLAPNQVAAVVEAELLTDPVRAKRYAELLHRCLVPPELVGCLAPPEPGHPPFTLVRHWLVLEEPDAWGDRHFLVFDHRRGFHLGFLGRSGH